MIRIEYSFGFYRGMSVYLVYFSDRKTHEGQRTQEGNQRGDRRPASSPGHRGQRPVVSAGTAEEATALGMSWVTDTAPKPHAGSSDGDTAIDFLSKIVTWSVLVCFARQRGMKNSVCNGLVIFLGAADGPLSARARRTPRCGCSGGPVSREWWIISVKH